MKSIKKLSKINFKKTISSFSIRSRIRRVRVQTYRERKKALKKRNTLLCKYGSTCKKRGCLFAHHQDEIQDPDYMYFSNPKYKEQQCHQRYCRKSRCIYYHKESEKRMNILEERLEKFYDKCKPSRVSNNNQSKNKMLVVKKIDQQTEEQQILPIRNRSINFSAFIPPLTHFFKEDLNNLTDQMLSIIKQINSSKQEKAVAIKSNKSQSNNNSLNMQECVNKVILNLLTSNSTLREESSYFFLNLLNMIPIIDFKYRVFQYERNAIKGQLSYSMRTNTVVPFVCQDILNIKPRSLKLTIRSLNKNWQNFVQIMETIQKSSETIQKIDINLKEFIGPKDIDQINSIFSNTLLSLKKIKVINLRLQFDYLEDGNYERDIVDIILELLLKIQDEQPDLKIQINIFRIVIKYQNNSIEVFSEKCRRNTAKSRNIVNSMFRFPKLNTYFINKFAQLFKPRKMKYFTIDFSNMYLTQKKQDKVPHHRYESGIDSIIEGLSSILKHFETNKVEKLSMKFFGFSFNFDLLNKSKRLHFKFLMNFQLFFQNTPVVCIKSFYPFCLTLFQKLNYRYKYSTFEGNLFTSKYYNKKNKRHIRPLTDKKKFIKLTISKASEFLNLFTQNFENVTKFSYFTDDVCHLNKILIENRKRLTHTIPLEKKEFSKYTIKNGTTLQVFDANKDLDFQRRQFLYIYTKMLRIKKRNPKFFFRKEIIKEIFDLTGSRLNLDKIY